MYICVCVYVYIYIYVYIYVYICIYMYIYVCVCINIYIYICIYIYIYTCMRVCLCIYIFKCMWFRFSPDSSGHLQFPGCFWQNGRPGAGSNGIRLPSLEVSGTKSSISMGFPTWWLIPLSKWVTTLVINGISGVSPLITGVISYNPLTKWDEPPSSNQSIWGTPMAMETSICCTLLVRTREPESKVGGIEFWRERRRRSNGSKPDFPETCSKNMQKLGLYLPFHLISTVGKDSTQLMVSRFQLLMLIKSP